MPFGELSPWVAKAVVLVGSIAMVIIRGPHGHRNSKIAVRSSRKGALETSLLLLVWLGFFLPLIWIWTPVFAFADYPLRVLPFTAGSLCLAVGLWFFYRSHADLGTNWSITLEIREDHRLITRGVYRWARHPMYAALFLYSIGQALLLPNWLAGPSYLVTFGTMFAFRVNREEQMMVDEFGDDYRQYTRETKRLVPGVW